MWYIDYAKWKEHEALERTKKTIHLYFVFYVLPHTRLSVIGLNTSHVCRLNICRRRAAKLRRQHDIRSVFFDAWLSTENVQFVKVYIKGRLEAEPSINLTTQQIQ